MGEAATITRQCGDVTAVELAGPPLPGPAKGSPGFPPSAPIMAPPVIPVPAPATPLATAVDVPDGDPETVALALLWRLNPFARRDAEARIELHTADVEQLVESARLGRAELGAFIVRAAHFLAIQDVLAARLGRETAADIPARIHALLGSVRRWADGEDLRREWTRRAALARQELASIVNDIQVLAGQATGNWHSDPNTVEHMRGLHRPADVWLRRMAALIRRRQDVTARLAALGEDVAARARAVTTAVIAAGRLDVAAAVAPAMRVFDRATIVRERREAMERELATIDPDSQRAAALRDTIADTDDQMERAVQANEADRLAEASSLIGLACTGDMTAIAELERYCRRQYTDLADALASTRGGPAQLVATIAEVIGDHQRRQERDATDRAALARRR